MKKVKILMAENTMDTVIEVDGQPLKNVTNLQLFLQPMQPPKIQVEMIVTEIAVVGDAEVEFDDIPVSEGRALRFLKTLGEHFKEKIEKLEPGEPDPRD